MGILYPPLSPYLYSELGEVAKRTGLGFVVMGFIGYFVKLILYARCPLHCSLGGFPPACAPSLPGSIVSRCSIPINNIILGG